ncbi:MAG: DUF4255 domain-containing protein [Bacteroidales bacterium]|nr:DUF4255 domain-containing protein [Bacteroidales bacterium]
MIYSALNTVVFRINDYLKLKYSNQDNRLELCNLLEQDGSLALSETNKVIATLVNIERETAAGINRKVELSAKGKHILSNPPIFINLYLLFTSVYTGKNYAEGLKFLSSIIEFLQSNIVIDHSNTPQLNKQIDKLVFEIYNMDIQNLSQLWGAIGGKYMPSVLFKVRMLTIDQENIKAELDSISQPNSKAEM